MSEHKKLTQAVVVEQSAVNTHQTVEEIALFNADGTPFGAVPSQAAAQADSVAATLPAMVTDFNALLAKLRAAGVMAT